MEEINNEKKIEDARDILQEEQNAHKSEDMVAKANEAAERIERANREQARLLQKQEQLRVQETLGGKADVSEPVKKEETPEEYAKKVMNNDI